MKPTDKELLEEYAKAIPNLTVLEKTSGEADLKRAFREQLLVVAGFKEEEIKKLDLSPITVSESVYDQVKERAKKENKSVATFASQVLEIMLYIEDRFSNYAIVSSSHDGPGVVLARVTFSDGTLCDGRYLHRRN